MSKKTVLVMLSSYNGEKYIEQQIRSILAQRDVDVYLRIRDDGSVDDTKSIIKQLFAEFPGRIELIEGENIGLNASFFALIGTAEGFDYYAISDQDDYWLPEKLSVAIRSLEKENLDMPLLFASTSYLADDDLKPYGQTRRQVRPFTIYNTVIQNICPGHTQVMNNALLKFLQRDWETERIYVYDSWIMNIAMLYGKIIFSNSSFLLSAFRTEIREISLAQAQVPWDSCWKADKESKRIKGPFTGSRSAISWSARKISLKNAGLQRKSEVS